MIKLISRKEYDRMQRRIEAAEDLLRLVDARFLAKDSNGLTTQEGRDSDEIQQAWAHFGDLYTAIKHDY